MVNPETVPDPALAPPARQVLGVVIVDPATPAAAVVATLRAMFQLAPMMLEVPRHG